MLIFVKSCEKQESRNISDMPFLITFNKNRHFRNFVCSPSIKKFITKCDSHFLLQSVTNIYYKVRQANLLQSVTKVYYKVRQVLQSVTVITKCDSTTVNYLNQIIVTINYLN